MTDSPVRVLLVDDHDVVHWGFRHMLANRPWVERCTSARTAAEAVALAERDEPHVALVDLYVGRESGAEICEQLRTRFPAMRVLLISGAGHITPNAARAVGAAGFVPKDWAASEIADAVRMVARGMTVFRANDEGGRAAMPMLSDRELEVLRLVAAGGTNREIADRLHLSPWTVKEYTGTVYRKLGARNRAEAVVRAQRAGVLD